MSYPRRPPRDRGTPKQGTPKQGTRKPGTVNRLPLNRMTLNRLPLNRLTLNPWRLNRLTLNRLTLGPWRLNRLPLNPWPFNRLPFNHLSLNRLPLNRLPLNRWRLNRLTLNRLPLNRLSLNRGDLLLLVCGFVAFLVLTFAPGIMSPGNVSGSDGARTAGAPYSRSASNLPPDVLPRDGRASAEAGSARGSLTAAPIPQKPLSNFPPAAPPTRILYPAAGLDVVIHPLNPSADELETQAIVPPITMDGYWVAAFGMPGAGSVNTTYILGHSWEGRDAPFNRLSLSSAPGDIFEATTAAGTMRYRVDSVDTYEKASLKDSPIWSAVPNRIILVSCYTEDPWGKNVVVVASPVIEP
jgi:hypothetical protein